MSSALSFHEPSITELLTLSSFVYVLNVVREACNVLHAGVVGEIALGIIYGTPLAGIIPMEWEETMSVFGYLGLILILFQGGLSGNVSQLKQTIGLSILIAFTGILCPIGISLLYLKYVYHYSTIESFAAGASLSSTSMGTTYAVLSSANLTQSKVGIVLVSAALIDDIVGLVIAGIISLLASADATTTLGWTIARPLVASLGVIFVPLILVRPIVVPCYVKLRAFVPGRYSHTLNLFVMVGSLSAFTTIATFSGTSTLLGAFVAGVMVSYLDSQTMLETGGLSLQHTYGTYVNPLQKTLLEPLFFASIGFAIPFFQLFNATIAWRSAAFGILSILTKSLTGLWILLWSSVTKGSSTIDELELEQSSDTIEMEQTQSEAHHHSPISSKLKVKFRLPDEHSVLAAILLGTSMIARGEVGLLIANIAFTPNGPLQQESYLVCISAILICTVVGPIGVGILARKQHGRLMDGHWGKISAST